MMVLKIAAGVVIGLLVVVALLSWATYAGMDFAGQCRVSGGRYVVIENPIGVFTRSCVH